MSYINVGAEPVGPLKVVKTKKAPRELLSQDPKSVEFYSTSPFTPFQGTALDIEPGTILIVCGPDPYTKRNWWARIRIENGTIIFDDKKIKPVTS